MLRTGQDDIFQKAFPDVVPYPPLDGPAPEAEDRSYNDRTELISLQYRGKLRKKVLDYAFERGLMHPEDMGPMTHWYSPTPRAFLDRFKPKFMKQSSDNYAHPEQQVWVTFGIRLHLDNLQTADCSRSGVRAVGTVGYHHLLTLHIAT